MKWHIFFPFAFSHSIFCSVKALRLMRWVLPKIVNWNRNKVKHILRIRVCLCFLLSNFLLHQFLANRLQNWVWQFSFYVHFKWQPCGWWWRCLFSISIYVCLCACNTIIVIVIMLWWSNGWFHLFALAIHSLCNRPFPMLCAKRIPERSFSKTKKREEAPMHTCGGKKDKP